MRDTAVVPNPKATRMIQAGDRLLCFGKMATLRELIPAKTRAKRKKKPSDLPQTEVVTDMLQDMPDPPQTKPEKISVPPVVVLPSLPDPSVVGKDEEE
jgi:ribosomal protein S6--L-glutamate ligase